MHIIESSEHPRINKVVFEIIRPSGAREKFESTNSRVNAGAQAIAQLCGQAAGLPFIYVALSANATTPAATDTTLAGEYTTNGLSRVLGTYGTYTAPSTLNGTATYVITASWTCTAAGQTVNKIAAFTAISGGTMGFETLLGATATLNNTDVGNLTWTFTV
jgi:hypothetical protein